MRNPWVNVTGLLLSLCAGAPALADELSPETVAKIQHDQNAEVDRVNAEHGNKKPSEMDSVERAQVIREQTKAQQAVLDKYNVDPKAYARYEATMSLDERAAAKDETKKLDAKDAEKKDAKPGAVGAAPTPGTTTDANGIVIERGTGEAKKADAQVKASTVAAEGAAAGAPVKATEPEKKKSKRRRRKSDE